MRAERQLIVWGRLKLQRGIVCAGDKSWCCHSDAELNPSLFLKGLICAEWAATPQRERTCWERPSWAPSRQERLGRGIECEGRHLSRPGGWAPPEDPAGVPGRAMQRRGRVRG